MNDDHAAAAHEAHAQMPKDLADVVFSFDEPTSQAVLANWMAIDHELRQLYCHYLDRGLFHRARRKRCQRLARQLTAPHWPLGFPATSSSQHRSGQPPALATARTA